jgi:hypothetical protein
VPKSREAEKQFTLDNLPDATPKDAIDIIKKQKETPIIITLIQHTTKEDELELKIAFKLPPQKSFSHVQSNLFFDNEPINSVLVQMLRGPLATAESEFSTILDMRGITAGVHNIGIEMYGLWDEGEKLCRTYSEQPINYVPWKRQLRLVKIPSVRSVAGADLAVVSNNQREIYSDIEKTVKKEQDSKRDNW